MSELEILNEVFEESKDALEKIIVGRRKIQNVYPIAVCPKCHYKMKYEFEFTDYRMYDERYISISMRSLLTPILDGLEVECWCGKSKTKVIGLILSQGVVDSIENLIDDNERGTTYRDAIIHVMIPKNHEHRVLYFDVERFKRGPRKGQYKSIAINEEKSKFFQVKKLSRSIDFFNFYNTDGRG